MSDYLEVAKDAALKAGKVLMDYYGKDVTFEKKSDNTIVSQADLDSEKIILDTIRKNFPEHSIYSEEEGKTDNHSEYMWFIDPLDGTREFAHKLPLFSVSIGLEKNNEMILGVVYLPVTDELFYAEKGKGAYLNGKKIKVSDNEIENSLFNSPCGISYGKDRIIPVLSLFIENVSGLRMIQSCAAALVYLAVGRLDFYILTKIMSHDFAAGKIILEEAGGKITQIDGNKVTTKSDNFIASNDMFHNYIIQKMKEEKR